MVAEEAASRSPADGSPGRRVRIAYLVHGVGGPETGVRTKILGQASAWSALDTGIQVGLFVRCEAGTEEDWQGEPHVIAVQSSRRGIVGRFVAREVLSVQVARWRPDVIYLRQSTVSPSLILLAAIFPTVIEVNTDDLSELRLQTRLRYWYARLTRDRLLRRARRIVVVTNELARRATILRLGRPVAVVPNSIDLAAYPVLAATSNERPHLVFIGAAGLPWAGVDKIVRLASQFQSWQFDLIGPAPHELGGATDNLISHGLLTRDQYLPIVARADVAIGPLALHRKRLSESSALKVAEYLAYGIPVIVGNAESAFPHDAPFLLQLPNTEDNVEACHEAIRTFVVGWMGRRVERGAVSAVDSRIVERRRLDLIKSSRPVDRLNK